MTHSRFKDKVVLITGGSSGIGLATAAAFIVEGAQVIITGRNAAALDAARSQLGDNVTAICGDIGDMQDITRIAAAVGAQFGHIDVLFANAGTAVFLPISRVTEADWDHSFNTNLKGCYFLVQKCLPWLQRGASIIFNCSVGASKVGPTTALYSSTKAGLRTLGKALAVELAPQGIRVNILSPGPIDTPLPHHTKGLEETQVSGFVSHLINGTAVKRMGKPEEVAAAVLFLASEQASYIVGHELVVDGGSLCM